MRHPNVSHTALPRRLASGVLLFMLMFLLTACTATGASSGNAATPQPQGTTQATAGTAGEGGDLVIPLAEITQDAGFYPLEVDGAQMEVIAVKAPDGTIRTAFNTCQVCYDSGRGYYKQSGDKLVCQNCGNQFAMSRVGKEAGGCNPWPIPQEDQTVTADSITISYDFLKESKNIFANWKRR